MGIAKQAYLLRRSGSPNMGDPKTKQLSLGMVETLWLVRSGKHASPAVSGKPRLKPVV